MIKQKKTKEQKQVERYQRRASKQKELERCKEVIARSCGISGNYSALELIVIYAAKEGLTVRGDVHPHQQIQHYARMAEGKLKPTLKAKTMKDFYSSRAWKILRYQAFERHGNKCQCCGISPSLGAVLHVDHIKPKSTHPHLALDLNNLQILCSDCNMGKINQFQTDWRSDYIEDEALTSALLHSKMSDFIN